MKSAKTKIARILKDEGFIEEFKFRPKSLNNKNKKRIGKEIDKSAGKFKRRIKSD